MEILLVVLLGLYAVLVVGYFKMVVRAAPDLQDSKFVVAGVALVWPVAIAYTLLKEALV